MGVWGSEQLAPPCSNSLPPSTLNALKRWGLRKPQFIVGDKNYGGRKVRILITPPFLFLLNISYTVITFLLYKEKLLQGRADSDSMMDIFLWLYPLFFIAFVIIIVYNNLPQGALPLCLKRLTHSLPEVGHSRRYLQDCFCSVAQSCPILCDPMDCSTPGFPVLH